MKSGWGEEGEGECPSSEESSRYGADEAVGNEGAIDALYRG